MFYRYEFFQFLG